MGVINGAAKLSTLTLVSGATLTPALNLGQCWSSLFLRVPTFASGGTHYIQASYDNGTTYNRLAIFSGVDAAVGPLQIAQAQSNVVLPLPPGLQYLKVENTTGIANGCIYSVFFS